MLKCRRCQKRITGQYIKALDYVWHPDCFICPVCKKNIRDRNFVAHKGWPYHEACYQKRFSPRCAGCGESITGNYIKAMGKPWHAEHFRCAECGQPLRGNHFYEKDGLPFCEKDYYTLFGEICVVCGQPIRETFITNGWGEKYCQRHEKEFPRCSGCGRLATPELTGGYVTYQDGRVMCRQCYKTAVTTLEDAEKALARVRKVLKREGLSLGNVKLPLQLAGAADLKTRRSRRRKVDPSGITNTEYITKGGKVVGRSVKEILVLYGQPLIELESILAHEFGHAWLFLNGYPELPAKVAEGICELCSYLLLKQQSGPRVEYRIKMIEKNKDREYGVGFRAARRAMVKHTLAGMLKYVKKNGSFPR
ncbi:MAG: protein DA1 [Anaerolineales bacterium]|nr:protein DA1 [Anaerolineales bacterium]